MKILETLWFTEFGSKAPIGIILGKDSVTGEPKAYIGTGLGHDLDADEQLILGHGAKLYPDAVHAIATCFGLTDATQ